MDQRAQRWFTSRLYQFNNIHEPEGLQVRVARKHLNKKIRKHKEKLVNELLSRFEVMEEKDGEERLKEIVKGHRVRISWYTLWKIYLIVWDLVFRVYPGSNTE